MEKRFVNCNNCNKDDYTVIFPEGKAQIHTVVKCNNCGLMYANPQTTFDISGKVALNLDKVDMESVMKDMETYSPETSQYLKKQYVHQRDFLKIFNFFKNKPKGKFLEIGSYAGVLLASAKEMGWDVLGIEPEHLPRVYSELKFGLKVLSGSFEGEDLPNNSFDVVLSTHVIEHIYDPKVFIQKAYDVLKPKGILILETPTYDSLTFRLLKHRERSVRCPGHIYFFTKKSLKELVESCGFKTVKHIAVGRTLTVDRLFTNIGIITGKTAFLEKISKKLKLEKFVVHINARDMQRIYCEKI
jgi:2-polyprenyl-3-methyl-5-hydroxy-6-metoxy-1,4-benzoquinol methylase